MPEEKIDELGAKIQNELAETISKGLNIPVFVISPEIIQKLLGEVKQLPDIENKYSASELREEVSNFVSKFVSSQYFGGTIFEPHQIWEEKPFFRLSGHI